MSDLSVRDQQVLMAISLLGDHAYGVSIKEKILERTQQDLSFGSVYAVLERLEDKGYVRSKEGEATAVRGGKKKLFYKVTGAGAAALNDSLNAMDAMRNGIVLGGLSA